MKKVCAILLCCLLSLTMLTACGQEKHPLTEDHITSDLTQHSGNYNLVHTEGDYSISNLEILEKTMDKETAAVTVNATAHNTCIRVQMTATINYKLIDSEWKMQNISVTDTAYTIVGAPNQNSLISTLSNYIGATGGALAIKGDKRYDLKLNLTNATWETKLNEKDATATLHITYKDSAMELSGYYNLTFDEQGWNIESETQEDGRQFPLLHLEKYKKLKK